MPGFGMRRGGLHEHQPSDYQREPDARPRAALHGGRHAGARLRRGGERPPQEPADRRVGGLPELHRLHEFGARAEALSRYLNKGTKVSIEGKLRWSQWEREGQKRSKIEVIVDELEFMSSRGDSSSYGGGMGGGYSAPAPAAPAYAPAPAPVVDASSSVYDEDIPF